MEKILLTDNANQAIAKINANFSESGGGGGSKIAEGTIIGGGSDFVFAYLDVDPGETFRILFPQGDWQTSASASYAKLAIGYRDIEENKTPLMLIYSDQDVADAYDVVVSSGLAGAYKDIYIGVRASNGEEIPYVVYKADGNEVHDYFLEEVADTQKKLKERIVAPSCLSFVVVTDIHYRSNDITTGYGAGKALIPYVAVETGANMKKISEGTSMSALVCLGDTIDGASSAFLSKCDCLDMMEIFSRTRIPLMNILGNHDDNRYGSPHLTLPEMYSGLLHNNSDSLVDGSMNGANWYIDFASKKIRFIGLCAINSSGGYAYTTSTQSWLSSCLQSLPEDYHAVIFTHVPLFSTQLWGGSTPPSGSGTIADTIQANSAKVLAVFQGHTHLDNIYVSPFFAIAVSCNSCCSLAMSSAAPEGAWFPIRTPGSYSEDLWDTVVIDKENGLISCIRFGAGIDRYIHYTPVEVAAGGTTTLTPSVLTASAWHTRDSESSSISINNGVVSVSAGATSGSRLTARVDDADGNMEFWTILVS